jgi:hypothetical protein
VDYGAFNLAALLFVRQFILKVKPTYTFPIFSVLFNAEDTTIDITDTQEFYGIFSIFDTPSAGINVAFMFDQPEDGCQSFAKIPPVGPIGSVCKNSYDCGYSARGGVVDWGHDKLCPSDVIDATMCQTFLVEALPQMDSIFAWDLPVYDAANPGVPISWKYDVPLPPGTYCRDKTL